jgi:hypothetical protein
MCEKPVYPSQASRSEYSKLFKLLDGYAKRHHKCFLAELFMSEDGDAFIMCFRPKVFSEDPQNQRVCQYVRIETGEARELTRTGLLTESIANILDEKLQPLSGMG